MLGGANARHVANALRQHADEGAAGGMALAVYGEFFLRKMAAASFDHAFLEGRGPRRHAIPEIGLGLCACESARPVTVALGWIFYDVILIGANGFVLFPDGRADGAVGVNRVVRPIAARIGKI